MVGIEEHGASTPKYRVPVGCCYFLVDARRGYRVATVFLTTIRRAVFCSLLPSPGGGGGGGGVITVGIAFDACDS